MSGNTIYYVFVGKNLPINQAAKHMQKHSAKQVLQDNIIVDIPITANDIEST
jgi:hypothetical protein